MWNKFLHNPFHIVKDYELRKLLWQSGSGTAVCKKYLKFRDTAPEKLTFPETQVDEPIWLFWNTGLEQAPEIVKTCYQSIKKYAGRQVVLLTENNVQNYINMPDYLNEKLKSGVLPLAIYTDLMRVALLEHYGGTWMDATILLTDEIPQEILNSDFFVFHNSLGEIDNPVLYPVWFIHAKQHNRTICEISIARYADLTKFALLEHYGGTWIDSTVYLTDPIPDMILNSDFFAVRNSLLLIDNPVLYPAWFLHAKKGNKTIREIRNVAFAYWLKNEHVIEYLLPNLIITLVVKSNPEVEKAIPYMNSDYSEYLVKVLADDYFEEKWNWIKKLTGIHKLTYKLDSAIDRKDSFYQHVIAEKNK